MGEVYRATDSVLGRTVAIKMLAERHAQNTDVHTRFTREALAAAQLSAHPHVVTVFDVGEHDGRPFIVMEYLDGGSVYDRLRLGPVEPERALAWLGQAAGGIDAAHERGIVHRDVKPANLLLDERDNVHVTDFGIASAKGLDTLTLPGTVLGTTGYLAPEQAKGEPATAASDRYALGVVAFELLTGRRPFAADTPVTEAFAHINAAVPSAERITPELPAGVDAALRRALAKEPAERPATATELVADLRDAFREDATPTLVQPGAAVVPLARPPGRSDRARRSAGYAIAAFAILLAGIAGAAFVAALDDDTPRRAATETTEPTTPTTPTTTTDTNTDTGTTTDTDTDTNTDTETDTETETNEPDVATGQALNDEGFKLMQAGDYAGALPLFNDAVDALWGSGTKAEAFASYNLAFTRFALGRCNGVLQLLDHSEGIQGYRSEIDELRRQALDACGGGSSGDGGGDDD
jgi:hypothetical protein